VPKWSKTAASISIGDEIINFGSFKEVKKM